ncbi:hypothetical protein ATSB10_12170 [Dyella thiooxydans]|uniref:DUF2059 domain-containing protein n=1 Tax=Dyella thiooxydans TaxID=445710 RepID=A0A160MZ49_9GAMM|nr:DUF2059 domain-containing protein [Dyella thiooxydans]AND68671.1 hypothetical protein ATSB10_12170 [Dyella thiooxydans]
MTYKRFGQHFIGALAGLLLAAGAPSVMAGQASAKQVRELMGLFGTDRMFQQMNAQMAAMMGKQLPCVPASYWNGFLDDQATRELSAKLVPIYQRHFTEQDVRGLLKFYRSPLGKKLLLEQPSIMAEVMQMGRQWGEQRAQAMMAQLQQNGTLTAERRCPPASGPQPALVAPAAAASSP